VAFKAFSASGGEARSAFCGHWGRGIPPNARTFAAPILFRGDRRRRAAAPWRHRSSIRPPSAWPARQYGWCCFPRHYPGEMPANAQLRSKLQGTGTKPAASARRPPYSHFSGSANKAISIAQRPKTTVEIIGFSRRAAEASLIFAWARDEGRTFGPEPRRSSSSWSRILP